jgi:hypothetical protein
MGPDDMCSINMAHVDPVQAPSKQRLAQRSEPTHYSSSCLNPRSLSYACYCMGLVLILVSLLNRDIVACQQATEEAQKAFVAITQNARTPELFDSYRFRYGT